MYREQGFKAVHKMVHLVKFIGKGCFFFLSAYITLLWLPGTQQQNKLKQFLVFANVGVLFSLEILPQACEKHIQLDFPLAISILEYYTARNVVMFQCISDLTELGIQFQ